jgi:hypothetical protein
MLIIGKNELLLYHFINIIKFLSKNDIKYLIGRINKFLLICNIKIT